MTAHLLWGPEKMPKVLALNNKQGLISHVPDFGSYRPAELEVFERSFLKHAANWKLIVEPLPIVLKTDLWFPDYILEHLPTAQKVPLEILGFWRKIDLEKLILKIQESFTGQFLIVVSEDRLIDESLSEIASQSIVTFKKTATADGVIQAACRLLGLPAKTKTD
jgi:predicted nuclease of restriction endonuclease-like RecB superfamily